MTAWTETDTAAITQEEALFEVEAPPPVSLADKFGVPPVSVLDRRGGQWQDRKRRWLSIGLASGEGRDEELLFDTGGRDNAFADILRNRVGATSVFDPVLCEVMYRWFSATGDRILDPFAGGSVRGVVASVLGRYYTGIDLRDEQVAANLDQLDLCSDILPAWLVGDSTRMEDVVPYTDEYDLVFSCPPYHDLEHYSEDPKDLSNMPYAEFAAGHRAAIAQACKRLRNDRFAGWVISDVRDPKGAYRGLVAETIMAFQAAGLTLHNDAIILDPMGTAQIRAERPFRATRKLARVHQHFLVFCKGDAKRAAQRVEVAGPAVVAEPDLAPPVDPGALVAGGDLAEGARLPVAPAPESAPGAGAAGAAAVAEQRTASASALRDAMRPPTPPVPVLPPAGGQAEAPGPAPAHAQRWQHITSGQVGLVILVADMHTAEPPLVTLRSETSQKTVTLPLPAVLAQWRLLPATE